MQKDLQKMMGKKLNLKERKSRMYEREESVIIINI